MSPTRSGSATRPSSRKGTGVHRPAAPILSGLLCGGPRAGEEPVVRVLELRIAQEDQVGKLLRQRPWRTDQPHPGFAQQAVALAPVATAAGDHLVLPTICRTPAGGRDDMVDRELRRRGRLATVLACAVVSEEEIPAVRSQQPPGDFDIGEQPDDDDVLA